jgi:catechol 2,3-dioxygenase-like lactoylglutathione lyase family enzyme
LHFDHVAIATRDSLPILNTLVADLGATPLQGSNAVGFQPLQLRLGTATEGMTIEVLQPYRVKESDFLARFLDARGEGPHHITVKSDDIVAELERARAAGLTPMNVLIDSPRWKEAFFSPKEAHGTVVQFAQGGLEYPSFAAQFESVRADGPYGEPRWWPDFADQATEPTILYRIAISTPVLDAAVEFYTDILDAQVDTTTATSIDVVWDQGGRVGLELDTTRPAGITRLELHGPGPARELVLAGTRFVINQ